MIEHKLLLIAENQTIDAERLEKAFGKQRGIHVIRENRFNKLLKYLDSNTVLQIVVVGNIEISPGVSYSSVLALMDRPEKPSILVIDNPLLYDLSKSNHINAIINKELPIDTIVDEIIGYWEAELIVKEEQTKIKITAVDESLEKQFFETEAELRKELSNMHILAHQKALEISALFSLWMQLERDTKDDKVMEFHHKLKGIISEEDNWNSFVHHFNLVHPDFFKNLDQKYPGLSTENKRMCGYLKMGLNNKEIGDLMKIMPGSVKKAQSRLKKKINLKEEISLREYISKL